LAATIKIRRLELLSNNASARIFCLRFQTDVSQPGAETVGGDYQINKRWSVSASRDPLGGVSVDGQISHKILMASLARRVHFPCRGTNLVRRFSINFEDQW
jgi:hypothetical protein